MSEHHAFYLIGEPGAGKTTLVEHLTDGLTYEDSDSPIPFRRYDCGVYEIGKRREGGFSGTDALAMNIQPAVEQFIESLHPRLVMAEGDRLSNAKFFRFLIAQGYELHVYQLWGAEVAAQQRAARGSTQNPTWLAGRATKVTGLRKAFGARILPAGTLLEDLIQRLNDPVSTALRSAKEAVPA